MNLDDTPRVADTIRLAGELLEAHGELAWRLTEDWQRGLRSPSLEPSASDRYETIHEGTVDEFSARVPTNDRTGEVVVGEAGDMEAHTHLRRALERMYRDAAQIVKIIEAVVPPVPFDNGEIVWCTNHLRIQMCEPVHRGTLCRWCYDFQQLHGQTPPPILLGIRNRYGRVTDHQVKEALAGERKRADTTAKVDRAVRAGRKAS